MTDLPDRFTMKKPTTRHRVQPKKHALNHKRSDAKLVRRRVMKKKLAHVSDRFFSNSIDALLFSLYLPILSFGKRPNSRDIHKTFDQSHALLEHADYKTIKNSLNNLKRKGFIRSIKEWTHEPMITKAGRARLASLMPQYLSHRPWKNRIYLISYDFATTNNTLRDQFRRLITKLGAIPLQSSLYAYWNNPYVFAKEFKEKYDPDATILISELSKQGFIGTDDIKQFLWEKADLDSVNDQYLTFINTYKTGVSKNKLFSFSMTYYSILKKDPQLPFDLLPSDYLGDKAYLLFRSYIKSPILCARTYKIYHKKSENNHSNHSQQS